MKMSPDKKDPWNYNSSLKHPNQKSDPSELQANIQKNLAEDSGKLILGFYFFRMKRQFLH